MYKVRFRDREDILKECKLYDSLRKEDIQKAISALEFVKRRLPDSFKDLESLISGVNKIANKFAKANGGKSWDICYFNQIRSINFKIGDVYVTLAEVYPT